ncbi:Mif2/CENP-C like-domain-containing protein [Mycena capillaripes]|nr:Mif2/CENP-C like-domain-containing protein [Mycena capillaripes]
MPPSARKSSVGAARRAVQKSHVPYRGDDPTVGKKTGISVQEIPRGSDGFEPFGELFEHAPAKPRKRKKQSVPQDEYEDDDEDENGEMSMDVDSPIQNYSNTRPPNTPRTARPISRTSEVDFDQVPSPRAPGSARRTAGPSRLRAQDLLDQDEGEDDYDGGGDGFDDYGAQEDDYGAQPGDSPRQLSFTEMDTRDDDDEEEEEELPPPPPQRVSPRKGKGKAPEPEPVHEDEDNDMEDDIAHGMDDVEMTPPDSDEEPSPPKKAPAAKEKPKPPAAKSKRQKENREVPEGVRRSRRVPIEPLEWWRNEKVEFGGRDPNGGPILVPRIKAIIRIPKEPVVPLGSKRGRTRKRSTPAPEKGKGKVKIVEKVVEVPVEVENPEEGWDDETETQAVVKSYPSNADVTRRIAFTAKMFKPSPAANNEWFYQKIFGDGNFIAAGQITIPPKGRKPSKLSKDNTFIFFVIEGAVNLKVCETSLIVASGGMFMIPRGNTYFIENIADRDAKLFFTQARKMREGERDEDEEGEQPVPSSGGAQRVVSSSQPALVRAASAGAGPNGVNGRAAGQKGTGLRRGMSSNV